MARTNKRIIEGRVLRDTKDKTGSLLVERLVRHPKYKRTIKLSRKFLFHDEDNKCKTGDVASIVESRRLSKNKSWRLVSVITN